MLAAKEVAEEGLAEEQVQANDVIAAAVQETVVDDVAEDKAARRRKLNEEAQEAKDLKKNLEVVNDKDDDV
nr:hypothetical protein [Tanacetum cinerariifolium]